MTDNDVRAIKNNELLVSHKELWVDVNALCNITQGGGRGKKTFLHVGMVTTLAQGLSLACHHFSKQGLTASPLAVRKATSTTKVNNFHQWSCPHRKLSLTILKACIFHPGLQCRGIAQHAACLMQMESIQRFRTDNLYVAQLGAGSVEGLPQPSSPPEHSLCDKCLSPMLISTHCPQPQETSALLKAEEKKANCRQGCCVGLGLAWYACS